MVCRPIWLESAVRDVQMHFECLSDSYRHVCARHHRCLIFRAYRDLTAHHVRAPPTRLNASHREGCCSCSRRK